MKKQKICLITPSLGCGGLERVVSELANYTSNKSIQVVIICLINSDIYYKLDRNVSVLKPDFKYKKGLLNKIKTFFYILRSLAKIKPDYILSFGEAFNPLVIIIARITFNRIFISDRSSPTREQSYRTNILRRLMYPFAHGIIAQTKQAQLAFQKNKYNKNIAVIPNPLREINDLYDKNNSKVIISAGRLVESKNFSNLIDIFSSLERSNEWKLIILGDGPQRKVLEKKIKKDNLDDKVFLIGEVKDVDKFLSRASIFAFTSLSEGFPNALSEAMAFPLACIAYDCIAGPSEIIQNKYNGILIPLNNSEIFKKELQNLINNPVLVEKYKSEAFKNRIKYSKESVCYDYLFFIMGCALIENINIK